MLKRQAPDHQHKALYQLRIVTRVFALAVILLLVVGYFLPKSYHIERSIVVDASVADVSGYLSDASELASWLYVQKGRVEPLDGMLQEGAEYQILYDSGESGLMRVSKLSQMQYEFDVAPKVGQRFVANVISLESLRSGNAIRVAWSINGELESGLLSPYLALFANDIAGANFEKSLSLLKESIEN